MQKGTVSHEAYDMRRNLHMPTIMGSLAPKRNILRYLETPRDKKKILSVATGSAYAWWCRTYERIVSLQLAAASAHYTHGIHKGALDL